MDEIDRAKEYTLVYGGDGKLYAVGKHAAVPIEGGPPSPVPADVGQRVVDDLVGQNPPVEAPMYGVEKTVEDRLKPYLTPHGSGVRVRVPKILD